MSESSPIPTAPTRSDPARITPVADCPPEIRRCEAHRFAGRGSRSEHFINTYVTLNI
jgi:hypothetical protein